MSADDQPSGRRCWRGAVAEWAHHKKTAGRGRGYCCTTVDDRRGPGATTAWSHQPAGPLRWNTSHVAEGVAVRQTALGRDGLSDVQAQAAVAALPADAPLADWLQIVCW